MSKRSLAILLVLLFSVAVASVLADEPASTVYIPWVETSASPLPAESVTVVQTQIRALGIYSVGMIQCYAGWYVVPELTNNTDAHVFVRTVVARLRDPDTGEESTHIFSLGLADVEARLGPYSMTIIPLAIAWYGYPEEAWAQRAEVLDVQVVCEIDESPPSEAVIEGPFCRTWEEDIHGHRYWASWYLAVSWPQGSPDPAEYGETWFIAWNSDTLEVKCNRHATPPVYEVGAWPLDEAGYDEPTDCDPTSTYLVDPWHYRLLAR